MQYFNLLHKAPIECLGLENHPVLLKVVWQTDDFVVVDFRHCIDRNKPWKKRKLKKIKYITIHQTYGNYLPAPKGIFATNNYCLNFLNWPSTSYQLYVPYEPLKTIDGRYVVYLLNNWKDRTYTVGGWKNGICAGVVFQGRFSLKQGQLGEEEQPSEAQGFLVEKIWKEYILPYFAQEGYYLTAEKNLRGHFELGKKGCPGRWLERWIKAERGLI